VAPRGVHHDSARRTAWAHWPIAIDDHYVPEPVTAT
jgi:hypothetical protein